MTGSDAAAGLRVMSVELVNRCRRPYALGGFPEVHVLGVGGGPLGVRVGHGSMSIARLDGFDDPPEALTLKRGERAAARLVWRNTVTAGNEPSLNGTSLRIAPAAGERARTVRPDGVIDLGTTDTLGVSPWTRSERG